MRRITQPLITLSALALVAGGLVYGFSKSITIGPVTLGSDQAIETLSTVGLSVEQITVEGRSQTKPEDILTALGAERGTPILEIDIPEARRQVTALPWVKTATIVRRLPNRLHITLEEHTAFAVWQHDGRHTLIAHDGTLITQATDVPLNMIVVVGDDAPAHAAALIETLAGEPQIQSRVKAAVRYGKRRWDVVLDDMDGGLVIKLPEENADVAWSGLAAINQKHGLLDRAIAEIDLRIPGRLVVRLLDGYAPESEPSQQAPAAQGVTVTVPPALNKEVTKGV